MGGGLLLVDWGGQGNLFPLRDVEYTSAWDAASRSCFKNLNEKKKGRPVAIAMENRRLQSREGGLVVVHSGSHDLIGQRRSGLFFRAD